MVSTRLVLPSLLIALLVPASGLAQAKPAKQPNPVEEAAKAAADDPEAGDTSGAGATGADASAEPTEQPASAESSSAEVTAGTSASFDSESVSSSETTPEKAELDTRYPNKKYIDAVFEKAQHQSLGYAVGYHGEGLILGMRYDIPVNDFFYMRLGPYANFGPIVRKPFDPVLEMRVETMFRGDLLFGLFRLYGGGGFWVGYRPNPACSNPVTQGDVDEAAARAFGHAYVQASAKGKVDASKLDQKAIADAANADVKAQEKRCKEQKDNFGITGGGYAGIEFFESPTRAFFIEIGGQGGIQKFRDWHDAGLILQAGSQFYF